MRLFLPATITCTCLSLFSQFLAHTLPFPFFISLSLTCFFLTLFRICLFLPQLHRTRVHFLQKHSHYHPHTLVTAWNWPLQRAEETTQVCIAMFWKLLHVTIGWYSRISANHRCKRPMLRHLQSLYRFFCVLQPCEWPLALRYFKVRWFLCKCSTPSSSLELPSLSALPLMQSLAVLHMSFQFYDLQFPSFYSEPSTWSETFLWGWAPLDWVLLLVLATMKTSLLYRFRRVWTSPCMHLWISYSLLRFSSHILLPFTAYSSLVWSDQKCTWCPFILPFQVLCLLICFHSDNLLCRTTLCKDSAL